MSIATQETNAVSDLLRSLMSGQDCGWFINWMACRVRTGQRSEIAVKFRNDDGGVLMCLLEILCSNIAGAGTVVLSTKETTYPKLCRKRGQNVIFCEDFYEVNRRVPIKCEEIIMKKIPPLRCEQIEQFINDIPQFAADLQDLDLNLYAYHRHVAEAF